MPGRGRAYSSGVFSAVAAALICAPAIAHAQRLTHPTGRILRTIPSDGHLYGVTIDRHRVVYVSKVHTNELLRVPFDATSPPVVAPIGEQ
ncbi:MAG: hypothetical protein JF590_08235, partial [Gemmatimonadetes bacterium]|nr:hypothetical protein [Gemmatimonadota bacterium]